MKNPLSNENKGHLGILEPCFAVEVGVPPCDLDFPKRLRASSLSFKQFCDQASLAEMRLEENHIEKSGIHIIFCDIYIYQICIAYFVPMIFDLIFTTLLSKCWIGFGG